jgi:hypothetical protein
MEEFKCRFEIEGLPSTVRSGQILNISAQVLEANAPVQTIVVSVPEGNIYSRMKKVSDNKFSLSLTVPYGGEGMSVQAAVYALSEDNRRSEKKYYDVSVAY